jgi:hypothetical protein
MVGEWIDMEAASDEALAAQVWRKVMPQEMVIDKLNVPELRLNMVTPDKSTSHIVRVKASPERRCVARGNDELWIEVNEDGDLIVHTCGAGIQRIIENAY